MGYLDNKEVNIKIEGVILSKRVLCAFLKDLLLVAPDTDQIEIWWVKLKMIELFSISYNDAVTLLDYMLENGYLVLNDEADITNILPKQEISSEFDSIDDVREPEKPTELALLFAKYHQDSILQTKFSVFYAKVKKKNNWIHKGIENTWFKKDLSLVEVYHLIKGDAFKWETNTLREIEDEKEQRTFKNTHFNYACFSGVFSRREDESLITHSRLVCIDLDKLGDDLDRIRTLINNDPLTIMSFVSPRGNGLKVLYQIDPKKHSQKIYYQYLSDYLANLCELPPQRIDKSCSDVSRACFLSHDPKAYLNLNIL